MQPLPTYMQELGFEDWLEQSRHVKRITDANISSFITRLSAEEDKDSYSHRPLTMRLLVDVVCGSMIATAHIFLCAGIPMWTGKYLYSLLVVKRIMQP